MYVSNSVKLGFIFFCTYYITIKKKKKLQLTKKKIMLGF